MSGIIDRAIEQALTPLRYRVTRCERLIKAHGVSDPISSVQPKLAAGVDDVIVDVERANDELIEETYEEELMSDVDEHGIAYSHGNS
uniref:Uncharacterized protein n=1 Tax=Solanum tuberosum TaxID=4113 RepID=M1ALD5_SOLTU